MNRYVITLVLGAGLLFCGAVLRSQEGGVHILWNQQNYAPEQPIAFSHRLHAGELQVDCRYCHFGADQSRHAGIPAASVCMNCHKFVTATFGAIRAEDADATEAGRKAQRIVSPEIQKLYDALALDENMQRDPQHTPDPIEWVKIHNVPDYVYFDHRPHTAAGVECQRCHGAVASMERVRQVETLGMGWCVSCHRKTNATGVAGRRVSASTDCAACHY